MLKMPDLVADDDDGNYTCVITNPHGQIQWTYILDVVGKW